MNEARELIKKIFSEYHKSPIDPWAAKNVPGLFVEILERELAVVIRERDDEREALRDQHAAVAARGSHSPNICDICRLLRETK